MSSTLEDGHRAPVPILPRSLWHRPGLVVVAAMAALVCVGTVLLMLPVARSGPGGAPLVVALFTSTSAACVTGLTVVDTGTYWSGFGQAVIAGLVQAGGLGLMTAAALLGILVAGRLGLRTKILAGAESKSPLGTVGLVLRWSAAMAVAVEATVALALVLRLWLGGRDDLPHALWSGLFHAVSAYNNAGFALWPDNLTGFAADPFFLLPVTAAFVVGGLGYPVLLDLLDGRPREWSLHTRLTLLVTGVLCVLGPLAVLASEWSNPATLGALDVPGRLLSGTFSGLSPRTAGFNTFDYGQADASTLLLTDVLMFVGGGSAGTAGGIKVTTFGVLVLAALAEARGDSDIDVFRRRIGEQTVRQAIAVAVVVVLAVSAAAVALLELTDEPLDTVLFEVVSATATVGLTADLTNHLPAGAQLVLVALMFAGRVGPMTLATVLALRRGHRHYRHPEARPLVG